jgi:hypothetical protein
VALVATGAGSCLFDRRLTCGISPSGHELTPKATTETAAALLNEHVHAEECQEFLKLATNCGDE